MTTVDSRIRVARRRAVSIGLRMVGGRGTIELFADGSRAHRGPLDTVEAYLAGRYCDPRRARTAVPAAWAQMIDNYLVTLSAARGRAAPDHDDAAPHPARADGT